MAKLLSSRCKDIQSVPADYILPPEKRPGEFVPICKDIPVLDLSKSLGSESDQVNLVEQIQKACVEYGIFQVINHGVSEKLMEETMALLDEFFKMSAAEKESLCADEGLNYGRCRLYTSQSNYVNEEHHYWKDALGHPCFPIEQTIDSWPEKPARYREVLREYVSETRKLIMKILDLMAKGMGIEEEGYFSGDLTGKQGLLVNHYPVCPNPSLTMGLAGHHDPNLLSVLQQEIYGLQVFKDGQWLGVEPLPKAFVINTGHQMEIISNGKLKPAEHRVVTNSETDRTSIGLFVNPTGDCVIEPAKALLSDSNPPMYRAFLYKDFWSNYFATKATGERALAAFELKDQVEE